MVDEQIIQAEKEYLVNVLGKKLIDSEERDDRKNGYRHLARKYWPDLYPNGINTHVHHIDFDHSNNVVSNLVVLTASEHEIIHYMFDPKYEEMRKSLSHPLKEETKKKISNTIITNGSCAGENNPMYGHNHNDEAKQQIGIKNRQHHKDNPDKYKKPKSELHKKHLSESLKKTDKNKGHNNHMFGKESPNKGTHWMNNGIDEMRVFPPWDNDMLIFGWKYGRLKRKA